MATLQELVTDLIKDLTAHQNKAPTWRDRDGAFVFPRMIPAGDGGSILVSNKIDAIIDTVALRMKENDPTLPRTHTDKEWITVVRNAFGPALFSIDLADEPASNATRVITTVKSILESQVPVEPREYAFGCTLFVDTHIASFNIGPVRIESRTEWLTRKSSEGAISKVTNRRVERAWRGQKIAKRKSSMDTEQESHIMATIGSCPYVCSVSVTGLAPEAGREKALTAARLALAAIALLWETPSKALEGFNLLYDGSVRRQRTLCFSSNKIIQLGSQLSHLPHGIYLEPGKWGEAFTRQRTHFTIVGDVLEYWLSPTIVGRPTLMNTLLQALLWFHEACRENVALMAIVKFTTCLDGLAGGKEEKGILRLLAARLGKMEQSPIYADGPKVGQVIEKIYTEGRSRTVHGTNNKLGYDWSITAGYAQQLARLCLLSCIEWAAKNPASDDPKGLSK